MGRLNLSPTILLLLSISHLCPTTAQLSGALTRCAHAPDLITATITNTHTRHVSVLKHNTLFDTSHLSVPFTLTDAAGTRLPLDGFSRIFYSGVSQADFLDLAPGANFTRDFNLTEYVALEPERSERFRTIRISLPAAFRGRKDHDGVYDVHPAAEGRVIDGQLRFGDVVKANLTPISHASAPFEITLALPARRRSSRRAKNHRRQIPPGLQVITQQCNPGDAAKAATGILHASYLAGAALNAASAFGSVPFNYFFPSNYRTAGIVAGVMNRVIASQRGQGDPIGITCKDVAKHCQANRIQVNTGYAVQDPSNARTPIIVLCPAGLALPPNPPPCSQAPGTHTIGWLVLHEMAHIQSISGPGVDVFDETGQLASQVGDAVKAGQDTTTDANAYAFLGSWAWDLGLGGPPWNQKQVCLERFPTGKFSEDPFFNH